jgi:FHS family L-fucose permease-like MFS transporter
MAHGMLDVLNKHFQTILDISKAKSGMIQFAMYIAYFLMALPAGYFMRSFGYKKGIILGLSLFAVGALLIAATTGFESFWFSSYFFCAWLRTCPSRLRQTLNKPSLVF